MIDIINLILVVVIIICIVVNLILLYKGRADIMKRIEDTSTKVKTMTPSGGAISILEFAEFEKLTPQVKELYRKYIVSHLLPKVMELANKELIEKKQIEELKKMLEKLASMSIQEMIQLYGPSTRLENNDVSNIHAVPIREIPIQPNYVTGAGLTTTDGLSPSQRFRNLGDFTENSTNIRYLLSSPHAPEPVELSEEEFNHIFLTNDHLRDWMAITWVNSQKIPVTIFTYDMIKKSSVIVHPFDPRQLDNITHIAYNVDGQKYAMLRDTMHVMKLQHIANDNENAIPIESRQIEIAKKVVDS